MTSFHFNKNPAFAACCDNTCTNMFKKNGNIENTWLNPFDFEWILGTTTN
jgi:hypothetical protein